MILLILCIITVCNQLLFKETVSISNSIPTFVYTDGDTSFIFSFKNEFSLKHSFYCLINKTVILISFSLLIICLSISNVNFINK